jgi:hypothetical protein
MSKEINTNKFAELLLYTIKEEHYFSKDILLPKIIALTNAFRLSLSASNYSKIIDPTETEKLRRSNDIMNLEKYFWRDELKEIVGSDNMEIYYKKLQEKTKMWNTVK